jgi:hypothetical protein
MFVFSLQGLTFTHLKSGDFGWAVIEARAFLNHQPHYQYPTGFDLVPYPLTAALFAIPFTPLAPETAGALFLSISTGLLVFGLTRHGLRPLILLLCYPFWSAIVSAQWSPMMLAAALLPWLTPITIAKPNLGFVAVLRTRSRIGLGIAAALVLLTLIHDPTWPVTWLRQARGYQGRIPLLTWLGPVLLLALFRRRSADARFFLLMSAIPQRWYCDALLLWLVPCCAAELLLTAAVSWGACFLTPPIRTAQQAALLSITFNYLPMLAIILLRRGRVQAEKKQRPPHR